MENLMPKVLSRRGAVACAAAVFAASLAATAWSQPGPGRGPRWGSEFTPGWALMTAKERDEHRERMRGFTDYAECRKYIEQHHEQMAARAKERSRPVPAQPRRDACAGLKKD
jgi:hypothetical protein